MDAPEDKKKKREYRKNRYHDMFEEKKQKLKEYQKRKYQETKKSKHNNKNSFFNNDLIVYLFSSILLNPYIQTN